MKSNQKIDAAAKRYRFSAITCCAVAVILVAACSGSSETNEMINDENNGPELIDPDSILANLEFSSAEDDASYQCLLSAATASASARGLNALPVVYEGQPIGRGAYATWCKTVGSSDAVNADIAACQDYLRDGLKAPGTEALQLFASKPSNAMPVQGFGLRSFKNAASDSTGFAVEYNRTKGKTNDFYLLFTPVDGAGLAHEKSVLVGAVYVYVDQENSINEHYTADGAITDQLAQLAAASATQFKTTVVANFEALKSQVAQVATDDALIKANTEIDRRIEMIEVNAEELLALAVEQLSIDQCE